MEKVKVGREVLTDAIARRLARKMRKDGAVTKERKASFKVALESVRSRRSVV